MKIFKSVLLLLLISILSCKPSENIESRLTKNQKQLNELRKVALENNKNPRSIDKQENIVWTRQPYDWTEGFWAGTCWQLFKRTQDQKWKEAAIATQNLYKHHKDLTNDHDLGFIFNNSFGKAYRITGEDKYKDVLIDAANSLITRFNDTVGCIQSWDVVDNWQSKRGWEFPVIIDNLMNLELLFEASKLTGNPKYEDIAIAHANTTMQHHFRSDGSSFHVVDYNPTTGEVSERVTAQGYADQSAWARGQSWALYGYTMIYRYTKDQKYLDLAEKIANFLLTHPNYPEDGVPYWDYNAPNIPHELRDASAGAIMASALLELSNYSEKNYDKEALHILKTLAGETYTAKFGDNGNFVLKHSVGSIPHGNEIDVPLNYADYYYTEALIRALDKGY